MDDTRWLRIHFMDGSEMQFDFPVQDVPDFTELITLLDKSMDSDKMILEVEGMMYIIPYSSIKYLRVSPCPEVLPDIAIRGANLAE